MVLLTEAAMILLSVFKREMVLRLPGALVGVESSLASLPFGAKTMFCTLKSSGGGTGVVKHCEIGAKVRADTAGSACQAA